MKLTNPLLLLAIILFSSQIMHNMQIHPEVTSCISSLITGVEREIEECQLPYLLKTIDQIPKDLAKLIGEFTGKLAAKYPTISSNRENQPLFCRLCPNNKWLLTISKIGLLSCQEIESGRIVLSHCVGVGCSDAVIDAQHTNLLVASNNNGYKLHHIDIKTGSKTDITDTFVSNPQMPFSFYPTGDPDLIIVVNDPSHHYNIAKRNVYHRQTHQGLHEKVESLVTWRPDNNIDVTMNKRKTTWSTNAATTSTMRLLPQEIRDIKKISCTKAGMIGITKDGVVFDITPESIDIITKIAADFSDIDIKLNTMAISHPTGDVSLFKIYNVMSLLEVYRAQIDEQYSDSNSDTDD